MLKPSCFPNEIKNKKPQICYPNVQIKNKKPQICYPNVQIDQQTNHNIPLCCCSNIFNTYHCNDCMCYQHNYNSTDMNQCYMCNRNAPILSADHCISNCNYNQSETVSECFYCYPPNIRYISDTRPNTDENNTCKLDSVEKILVDTMNKGVENEQVALIVAQLTNSLITNTDNMNQTLHNLLNTNIIDTLNKAIKIHSKSANVQKECKVALNNLIKTKPKNKNTQSIGTITNNNDKGYTCIECGKVYKHYCNLRSHFNIHTDRAYICEYCGKKFGRKSNYTEHRRVHTGERPFKCTFCSKSFKRKNQWKKHVASHESTPEK
eukprot:327344_1